MLKIEGVFAALITPMNQDESLNHQELANQVRRQFDAGVNWIFCLGTNGEFYAVSQDEKVKIMESVVSAANGDIKVCAGVGGITTAETILLAKKAEALGVHMVSVITPFFVSVSHEQLVDHYRKVASAVKIPVVLYNIPARTGNSIDSAAIAELEDEENILAIKDSSGKMETVKSYVETSGGLAREFSVLVGTDSLILSGLKSGAVGCVSGLANVVPEIVVAIYTCWKKGDVAGAAQAQRVLTDIRSILSFGNSNTIAKRATELMGYPVGPARRPVRDVPEEVDDKIREILAKHI